MLIIKQGGIRYNLLNIWYDLDWTPISLTIGKMDKIELLHEKNPCRWKNSKKVSYIIGTTNSYSNSITKYIIRKFKEGYKFTKLQENITYLVYTEYIEIFAKNKKEIEILIHTFIICR